MICPRCKTEMNDDMNYCPQCGLKIEKCPHCHQPIMPNAKFCSHCGMSINPYHQSSHIDGYYEPLQNHMTQTYQEETVDFKDIPTQKKVNKKVLIMSVVALVVISTISYAYVHSGQSIGHLISDQNEVKELPKTKLSIESTTSLTTHTGNINFNGQVYQTDTHIYMSDDQGYLIKMDKNLENRQTLLTEKTENINVVKDIIYYTNAKNELCSVSVDGKDQKVLINQAVYYVIVKDDKIYYQLDDNRKENIYVYDIKTNQSTKLNERKSYCLNVVDDLIYFTSDDGIYKIGIDGKGEEKLLDGQVANLLYQDGALYFINNAQQLQYYNIDKLQADTMLNRAVQLINMTDDYIFYLDSSHQIEKYDIKNKKSTKIYSGNYEYVYVVGDKLIVNTYNTGFQTETYKIIMDFDGNHQQRLFVDSQGNFV